MSITKNHKEKIGLLNIKQHSAAEMEILVMKFNVALLPLDGGLLQETQLIPRK